MLRRLRFVLRLWSLSRTRVSLSSEESLDPRRRQWPVIEAVWFLGALLFWAVARPAPLPEWCGLPVDRLVFLQRNWAAMGVSLSMAPVRIREQVAAMPFAEAAASFRIEGDKVAVSRGFFPTLGVRLPEESAAAGPLPEGFFFASPAVRRYVPLPEMTRTAGLLVRLKDGVGREAAEAELHRRLGSRIYRLAPYRGGSRWRDAFATGIIVAAVAWAGGSVFLLCLRRASPLFLAALGARLLMALIGLSLVAAVIQQWLLRQLWPVTILHLWAFLTACLVTALFILRDHRDRCPVCLHALRMPTRFGSWGSLMLDVPGTEYACPRGHGLLYVDETGVTRARWSSLDATWRDLFPAGNTGAANSNDRLRGT